MSGEHFRINRLEQYIMAMGYPLPSMGKSDEVDWVYPMGIIAKQAERLELLQDALGSLIQGYDSEEVAHNFGIDQDTAYKAVMALDNNKE